MDKVSSIVASNARIESVDLSKNKAGRTKLPGLARDNVVPSERLPGSDMSAVDRMKLTDQYKALKPTEARHLLIAEKAQTDFFQTYSKNGVLPKKHTVELPSSDEMPIDTSEENLNLSNTNENVDFQEMDLTEPDSTLTSETEESIDNSLSLYA